MRIKLKLNSKLIARAIFFVLTFSFWVQSGPSMPSRALAGGDDIQNGGGIAEKNFLFAFQSIETYSKVCLELDACRLTNSEKLILKNIVAVIPQEARNPNLIQFVSEKKNPGFFIIDGEMKVAKTGRIIGSSIFINIDLIYFKGNFGGSEAVSIPMALGILLHEFGHHVSLASHSELDSMGVKVASFLQNKIQTTPVLPWTQSIMATVVQLSGPGAFPQILLNVGDSVLNISEQFRAALKCPEIRVFPGILFPDLDENNRPPVAAIFHNIHWEKSSKTSENGVFVIVGSVSNTCLAKDSGLVAVNSFVVRIRFVAQQKETKKFDLKTDSVRISQDYEPWFKLFKILF